MRSMKVVLKILILMFLCIMVPHCQLYAKETISIEVRPIAADKVWNTSTPRDQNPNGMTDTYYYPWVGDNNVTIIGFEFVNLTEKKSSMIEKYGISVACDLDRDIQSATTEMDFLGENPISVVWNNKPVLTIAKMDQAEADGYIFVLKIRDGICKVVDNGEERITPTDWNAYYEKAKESCNLILKWQENKGGFGSKENPSYGDAGSDIWCVFSAARCGYVPYNDPTWFDRWYLNTKDYIEKQGVDYFSSLNSTDVAKLILAIEAIGYDPRDIVGVDLLEIEGRRNGMNLLREEYAVHAIMSGDYSAASFNMDEMETWIHKRAASLKNSVDAVFKNADNTMGWQPLVYWYGKEGFEDVTEAVDSAIPRLASIAQRATGAICTAGYEEACPMYANNAWNDAQALLFASEFGTNVIRPESGFTKNGNNILDAVFALINYEEGTIPGFYTYEPAQITRGLNSFIREYERDILGMASPPFWILSDVKVPTRSANDAIIALNGKSTDQEIAAAREAYESLDDTHKAIFNQEFYQKLVYFENGGRDIEATKEAIGDIPDFVEISISDKDRILFARAAYDTLSEEQKEQIGTELLEKLTRAEIKLEALEVGEQLTALNRSSTDADIANARERYEGLSEEQKGWILDAYEKLVYYESGGKQVDPVIDQISIIPDNDLLKLADKALIIAARNSYDSLPEKLKALLPALYLNRLIAAEQRMASLEAEAQKQNTPTDLVKKGQILTSGKNRFKITKISGKKGEVAFVGCNNKKLTKVNVPDSIKYKGFTFTVVSIEKKALSGYKKLTAVTIGSKVKTIGASAFLKCGKLKKITIKATGLYKVGKNALKGIYKKAVIKVPKKKLKAYKKLLKGKGQKKTIIIK